MTALSALTLHGVDHSARPTWRLSETVRFYRDVMGLPLVHAVSARGWGADGHPDFLHFFFDSGAGSTIAFFHYLGTREPDELARRPGRRPVPEDPIFDATHVAWSVPDAAELDRWKARLESFGVVVSARTRHEIVESIYFRDPNGYFLEIAVRLRVLGEVDAHDAALTLQAAMQLEDEGAPAGSIDEVWRRKARLHRMSVR